MENCDWKEHEPKFCLPMSSVPSATTKQACKATCCSDELCKVVQMVGSDCYIGVSQKGCEGTATTLSLHKMRTGAAAAKSRCDAMQGLKASAASTMSCSPGDTACESKKLTAIAGLPEGLSNVSPQAMDTAMGNSRMFATECALINMDIDCSGVKVSGVDANVQAGDYSKQFVCKMKQLALGEGPPQTR